MECGECTLCCTLFPVEWLDKPINTVCVHCDKGCKIHDTKPRECSDFNCAYRQSDKANIAMRPDNSGVVFEKLSDLIMWGTSRPGYEYTDIIRGQIHCFQNEGLTVFIKEANDKNPTVFYSEGHTREYIEKEMKRLEKERNGYSNVHN